MKSSNNEIFKSGDVQSYKTWTQGETLMPLLSRSVLQFSRKVHD